MIADTGQLISHIQRCARRRIVTEMDRVSRLDVARDRFAIEPPEAPDTGVEGSEAGQ
jgi:hypothetical protein